VGLVTTKTEMRRIARRARQHGHYRSGADLYVYCPDCRAKVASPLSRYAGTVTQQLDRAMLAHLADDCPHHQPSTAPEPAEG
jgi:hypothetical protein